jgi:hypothetical protein
VKVREVFFHEELCGEVLLLFDEENPGEIKLSAFFWLRII